MTDDSRHRSAAEGSVKVHLVPERRAILAGEPARLHVLLALESEAGTAAADRPPLNIALVLDRSGSMTGEKLAYCQRAAMFAVEQLAPSDRLAVVAYDDEVTVVQPSGPVKEKDHLKRRIAGIDTGGMTNLSGGYLAGCAEVRRLLREASGAVDPRTVNRVLLLTDGLANVGLTDRESLVGLVAREAREMSLTTIGVGDDFDEDLLVAMADAGRGHYHYISSPDGIPAIFAEELEGLVAVVAQDLRLRLRPLNGNTLAFLYGYPATPDGEALVVRLPDAYGAERKIVVFALDVPAREAGTQPLAEAELTYRDATAGGREVTVRTVLEVEVTSDPGRVRASAEPEVSKEAALQQAAEARKAAVKLADSGELHRAAQLLVDHASDLDRAADALGAAGHPSLAKELWQEGQAAAREANAILQDWGPHSRKQVHFSAYSLRTGRRRGRRKG